LTNTEFVELQLFANKYQLPSRRNELLLAQISQYVAMTMGGAKASPLNDYMPYRDAIEVQSIEELSVEEIRAMYEFTPST
jgi:hypothetical protein